MGDERISRIVRAMVGFYSLLTISWVGALGWHLGGLMAYRPEADRTAIVVLLAGPVVWGMCQPLGQRRHFSTFMRTSIVTAAFVACFAEGTRGHVPVLNAPVVAGFSIGAGLIGLFSCTALRLVVRLHGHVRPDHFRLTRQFRFCVETLTYGIAAAGLAHLFLWRARVERPPFDPIEFPNAYSRSMDLWTYGFLLFLIAGAFYLCWHASRLRRIWRNTGQEEIHALADSTDGGSSKAETETVD